MRLCWGLRSVSACRTASKAPLASTGPWCQTRGVAGIILPIGQILIHVCAPRQCPDLEKWHAACSLTLSCVCCSDNGSGRAMVLTKGAAEMIMPLCSRQLRPDGGTKKLSKEDADAILRYLDVDCMRCATSASRTPAQPWQWHAAIAGGMLSSRKLSEENVDAPPALPGCGLT